MVKDVMTIQELGEYLDVPVSTIYQWRAQGKGPRAAKLGRHLRYRLKDVDHWLETLATEDTDCDMSAYVPTVLPSGNPVTWT